ncbi:MAG: peptide ABC transporter substrate-binding protein, partial [Anaerolineae bacterium]|nr:peptide ABC transporter substrate-binding protein [Anaerolineae bacterium]
MTIPDDRQLGDALTDASRDVKPVDLWERLREPTSEIAAQQARRYRAQRRFGALRWAGLAAAVLLVTLGTFVALNRVQPLAGPAAAPKITAAPPRPTLPQAISLAGVEVGKGGTLRYNLGTYPDTLDPHQASQLEEVQVVRMLYEGLTKLDANLNVVGAAAESWRVAEDGITWTFTLRPGLKYSDGTPLTAANFEYALKRAASPELGAPYQSSTFDIQGAEAYGTANPKTTTADDLKALRDRMAVKALDDRTLQIQTRAPIAYLPSLMSLWITYPVREDVTARGETWWREAKNHICNGPFVLQELREGEVAVFVPNPSYYDPPKLGRLEFRFIKDSHAAFAAYRQGELDVVNLAADDLDAALKDSELSQEIVRYSGACTIGFLFNMGRPPFDNRYARLAFAKALDREQYVRDILRGIGRPTTAWIPVGLPDYNPDAGAALKFDPAAGREAWLKSGYTGEVKLTYAAGSRNRTRF